MKKILFIKLLNDSLSFFLITTISLSVIIWVFQAVNYFDIIIEDGRSYWIYVKFTLLNFPKILTKVIPFSLFISFLYVISNYEITNQLMIFWNFGVNKIKIINFFFLASFVIVAAQLIMTIYIVPKTQEISRSLLKESKINYFENFIKPKKFNDTVRNLTIYSDQKDKSGKLKNIYIKKVNDINSFQITYAKEGIFEKTQTGEMIVLEKGETVNVNNDKITIFKFSKSNFILKDLDPGTIKATKTQENTTMELIRCVRKFQNINLEKEKNIFNNCKEENLNEIYKELYKRFIIPFYSQVLILISLLLIIFNKENQSYFKYRIIIFLLGFITIILSESILRYSQNTLNQNLKIIMIPFIMTFFLYLFYYYKFILKSYK